MLFFENDYSDGAHKKVMEMLVKTNEEKANGYGVDQFCEAAKQKIRKVIKNDKADIYFLAGGTLTNAIIIDSLLQNYEGVVAPSSGHINTSEAGAVEASGHKIISLDQLEGKINPQTLLTYLQGFEENLYKEHTVYPGMVFITYPTEYGTLYSKDELKQIYKICKDFKLPLYIDGARLGYGLMSDESDLTLEEIAKLCDVFYIGGTKIGALLGEAVVFSNIKAPSHFVTVVKQHGGLLAKGRALGVQFEALFTNNLYWEISKNAINMTNILKNAFKAKGYVFFLDSPTNQQFLVLSNDQVDKLQKNVRFSIIKKIDDTHFLTRFVVSWSTTIEDINKLIGLL